MKSLLYIFSQPPYSSNHNFEMIDSAMVGAIFDLRVSLLYTGEGVWSLYSKQNGEPLKSKTYSKVLSGLSTYEIDSIYFCEESAQNRDINLNDLVTNTIALSLNEQRKLIADQDVVMTGPR